MSTWWAFALVRRHVAVRLRGLLRLVHGSGGRGLFLTTVRTVRREMIALADAADKGTLRRKKIHGKIPSGSQLASPPSPARSAFRNRSGDEGGKRTENLVLRLNGDTFVTTAGQSKRNNLHLRWKCRIGEIHARKRDEEQTLWFSLL